MSEPTLYEKSVPGRSAIDLPELDVPEASLPEDLLRHELRLPELSQLDVVRHYQRLAERGREAGPEAGRLCRFDGERDGVGRPELAFLQIIIEEGLALFLG